jgi:hypothetical protein
MVVFHVSTFILLLHQMGFFVTLGAEHLKTLILFVVLNYLKIEFIWESKFTF